MGMPTIRVLVVLMLSLATTTGSALAATAHVHSSAGMAQAAGLAVSRLDVFVRPTADGRLIVDAHLRVRNTTAHTKRRSLQVGPCVSGSRARPTCPSAGSRAVVLPPHATRAFTVVARMNRPPASFDALQATLAAPGLGAPIGRHSDAFVLVGSRAWSPAHAGRRFGIDLTPQGAHSLTGVFWDLHDLGPGGQHIALNLAGPALSAPTATLNRCAEQCNATQMHVASARGGPGRFAASKLTGRTGADFATMQLANSGEPLGTLTLPWPG